MILIRLVLLGLIVIASVGLWSQVVYPALLNRPLFPFFNRRRRKALQTLEDARERENPAHLEQKATRAQFRVSDIEAETYEETQTELDKLINNN